MYSTKKLKKLRIKENITIYDMAKILNISPSYYSLIESHKRNLSYDLAVKIAKCFNQTPDQIFLSK